MNVLKNERFISYFDFCLNNVIFFSFFVLSLFFWIPGHLWMRRTRSPTIFFKLFSRTASFFLTWYKQTFCLHSTHFENTSFLTMSLFLLSFFSHILFFILCKTFASSFRYFFFFFMLKGNSGDFFVARWTLSP